MTVEQTQVDWRQLQRYIVRIDKAGAKPAGTGFFVAPGIVLTCAHVVAGMDTVSVVRAEPKDALPIPARVVARSHPRAERSVFWPFPDLAVVELEEAVDHPCVRLDPRGPARGECFVWGFAERESGIAPVGSAGLIEFAGEEGDRYLRLVRGEVEPGLSGAPLICPTRRAVVAAIALTAKQQSDLGGWAAPIAALGEQPLPSEPLHEWGKRIWEMNGRSVVREREGWHRVLPLPDAVNEVLQPWTTFSRRGRSCPSDLLRADYGVAPFLFRNEIVDEAVAWCKASTSMGFWRIAGRGGAGKTRFATELCQRLTKDGWVAGFWREDSKVAEISLPRLIVFDYSERYNIDYLSNTLDRLRQRANDAAPVQVLVLNRTIGNVKRDPFGALSQRPPASLQPFLDDFQENDAATAILSLPEREQLFGAASARFYQAWFGKAVAETQDFKPPDLSGQRYELPLDVLFEALDAVLGDRVFSELPARPVGRVLSHESRYWAARAPEYLDTEHILHLVAAATFAGADTIDDADALLNLVEDPNRPLNQAQRWKVMIWLRELYAGPKYFNPLVPDRLGEALVTDWLRSFDDEGYAVLRTILSGSSDEQTAQAIDTLARLLPRDLQLADTISRVIFDVLPLLATRAEKQAARV